MHRADILHVHRSAVLRFERDVFNISDAFDVTAAADVVFGGSDLEDFAAHIAVGHADFVHDFIERDAVGEQFVRIDIHLVLLYKTADGRDFGDPFDRFERITEVPILKGAQLGQVVFARLVHQRVFVNPANTGGIGTNYRINSL